MGKPTTVKKKPSAGLSATAASQSSGSLLDFFSKSPSTATRRSSGSKDIKPDISAAGLRRTSSSSIKAKAKGKGKERASFGSEADPVVISDDEEAPPFVHVVGGGPSKTGSGDVSMPPPAVSPVNGSATKHSAGGGIKRRKVSPEPAAPAVTVPAAESMPGEVDDDIVMAGPSRMRSQPGSCSPPPKSPPRLVPETIRRSEGISGDVPPAGWNEIIDAGGNSVGEVDGDDADEREHDDDDSVAGRSDGDHDDNVECDEEREINQVSDSEEIPPDLDEADEIIPLDDPPDPRSVPEPSTIRQGSPSSSIGGAMNHLTLDMDWGEDAEEGMGMEDFGEDEGEGEGGEEMVLGKRKSKRDAIGLQEGKGKQGGKATTKDGERCPVCDKNLKGVSQTRHINACLDTSCNPSKTTKSNKTSRPISSFAFASPAPSTAPSPSPPPEEAVKGPNAFSVLMSGHKEREQWKDAEIDLKRDGKRIMGRRKAPFYKVLTGMPVAVDAFRYGAIPKVKAYLLSHAHSDHYTNLSKSWHHGPIYCSETTGNLIVHMLGVEPQWVHGLPENIPYEMPNTGGVKVTVIEANHCPGSSIFLFEGRQTVNAGDNAFRSPYVGSKRIFRYLHCGDFRACPKMVLHPEIARARIDTCYLDTTYLNPKYCFPPQPQVIEACAQLARKTCVGLSDDAPPIKDIKPPVFDAKPELDENGEVVDTKPGIGGVGGVKLEPGVLDQQAEERGKMMMKGWLVNAKSESDDMADGDSKDWIVKQEGDSERLVEVKKPKGRTLVVMGTYSIGKERIVKAVAKAIGSKIYCDPRKTGILRCETDPELHSLLSPDPIASQVHLLPLGNIQLDRLQEYLTRLHPHFDRVLGFRPTGWTYSPPAGTDMMPDVNMVIRRDQARWFTDASLKPMRGSCRQYMMYGVPYSEHSSFFELTCFALSMPGPDLKMIATVNVGNEKSRAKMKKWFEKWTAEKAKRKEKNLPAVVDYRDITYW